MFDSLQVLQTQPKLAHRLVTVTPFDQDYADLAAQFRDLGAFSGDLSELCGFSCSPSNQDGNIARLNVEWWGKL